RRDRMRAGEAEPLFRHRVDRRRDVPRIAKRADVRRLQRVKTHEDEVVVLERQRMAWRREFDARKISRSPTPDEREQQKEGEAFFHDALLILAPRSWPRKSSSRSDRVFACR